MPGSKCKMPSELNGRHIRHEFRGKAEITSSCDGQGRPHSRRHPCKPGLKDGLPLDWQGKGLVIIDVGEPLLPKGWMKKCMLFKCSFKGFV